MQQPKEGERQKEKEKKISNSFATNVIKLT
jgi:hypothetical protein